MHDSSSLNHRSSSSNLFSETFSENFINQYPLDVNIPYKTILSIFIITYVWTLALVAIPVFISVGPQTFYEGHKNWFSGSDIIRLVEPFGGLILNFLVFYYSGILKKDSSKRHSLCIYLFIFGGGVYLQGAAFHTSSTMFKNGLETVDYNNRDLTDLAYYMRTVWEHIASHYMYAAGYAIMNGCQLFAYKDHKSSQMGLTFSAQCLLIIASVVLAVLITAVAIDFPSGTIVGFIYLVVYGMFIVGGYMWYVYRVEHDSNVIVFGNRPILHHFFLSYVLALLLLIAWIATMGGFKSASDAGVV